jgi:hypothetical protein
MNSQQWGAGTTAADSIMRSSFLDELVTKKYRYVKKNKK